MKMELLLAHKMGRHWFLTISLLFFSCLNNTDKNIGELISRDTFRDILIEVEMIQFSLSPEIINQKTSEKDSLFFLNEILHRHNISEEMYKKTLLFYLDRPEAMLDILREVKDSIKTAK